MSTIRPDSVVIGRGVLDDIARHAREEAPNECCGLLVGQLPRIEGSVRAKNLRAWRSRLALAGMQRLIRVVGARSVPLRYLVDPRDHFAALKLARSLELTVLGAYHSHPGASPMPSRTDLREASDPEMVHVIVTPASDSDSYQVRAWRLENGRSREVTIVTPD